MDDYEAGTKDFGKMREQIVSGVDQIAAERRRQIEVEGWTAEHDDQHFRGEMSVAAVCYALGNVSAVGWPWERSFWKPSHNHLKNLVKAGALIAAEIDRLERLNKEPAK